MPTKRRAPKIRRRIVEDLKFTFYPKGGIGAGKSTPRKYAYIGVGSAHPLHGVRYASNAAGLKALAGIKSGAGVTRFLRRAKKLHTGHVAHWP